MNGAEPMSLHAGAVLRCMVVAIGCLAALISLLPELLAGAASAAGQEKLAVVEMRDSASPAGGTFYIRTIDPLGAPIDTLVSVPAVNVLGEFRLGSQVGSVSWSPDGSRIAYHQLTGAERYQATATTSYIIPVASTSGVFLSPGGQVPGLAWDFPTQNMNWMPAWSPKGDEIAYWANTPQGFVLRTIHPDGSGMRTVTVGGSNPQGASQVAWSPDGKTIAFSSAAGADAGGNLLKVPAAGGTTTYLALPEYDGTLAGQPAYSPDGKSIAFIRQRFTTFPVIRRLVVRDLATGAERPVTDTYPARRQRK